MTDQPPPENPAPATAIGIEDFNNSPAPFRAIIRRYRIVFDQIFELLNDPEKEHELIDTSRRNLPAIAAIKDDFHNEFGIVAIFNGLDGNQFRNTIGHVVCKKNAAAWLATASISKMSAKPLFQKRHNLLAYRLVTLIHVWCLHCILVVS